MNSRKKSPPYGRPLCKLQQQGYHPTNSVYLFIGNHAWNKGKNFSTIYPERLLILPPWISSKTYHWPVSECDILIFDTGFAEESYIEELVTSLYEHNALIVRVVSPIAPLIVYYKE